MQQCAVIYSNKELESVGPSAACVWFFSPALRGHRFAPARCWGLGRTSSRSFRSDQACWTAALSQGVVSLTLQGEGPG